MISLAVTLPELTSLDLRVESVIWVEMARVFVRLLRDTVDLSTLLAGQIVDCDGGEATALGGMVFGTSHLVWYCNRLLYSRLY